LEPSITIFLMVCSSSTIFMDSSLAMIRDISRAWRLMVLGGSSSASTRQVLS